MDEIAVSDQRKAELFSRIFQENFNVSTFPCPTIDRPVAAVFQLGTVAEQIHKALGRLRASAPGSDGITPAFIKSLKDILAEPIAALALKCMKTGTFPDSTKTAWVTTIPEDSCSFCSNRLSANFCNFSTV